MIRANSVNLLNDLLGKVISYGFLNNMNNNYIESKLINSDLIRNIENGNDSFLYRDYSEEKIIKNIYNIKEEFTFKINEVGRWIAEAYLNVFFKFKKSFSFILLYLPLETMKFLFDKYHEIDFRYLELFFEKEIKKETILRLLIKRKDLTQAKLSVLTGININVISKYNADNKYIYGAGFDNIYKISKVLEVNSNIFLKSLDINLDTSIFKFDKTNPIYRSFLGLYLLSFYDSKIASINWVFNKPHNNFTSSKDNKTIYVRFVNHGNDYLLDLAKELSITLNNKENIILCLFDFNDSIFSSFKCDLYRALGFKNIYIMNQLGILNTKNGDVLMLVDKYNINIDIINRAKESANKYLEEQI